MKQELDLSGLDYNKIATFKVSTVHSFCLHSYLHEQYLNGNNLTKKKAHENFRKIMKFMLH